MSESNEDSSSEDLITKKSEVTCTGSGQQKNLLGHPRGKSKCWRFFRFRTDDDGKIIDKNQVLCWLCPASLSYSGNTTNIKYHIQKHHPEHSKDIDESVTKEKNTDCSETSESGFKQLSLQATLNKVKPYPKDSQRHQMLVNAVGEFICYGLQPISVADDPTLGSLWKRVIQSFSYHQESIFLIM